MNRLTTRRLDSFVQEADADDSGLLAQIHHAAFQVAWTEDDFHSLLLDRSALALIAKTKDRLDHRKSLGFILIRIAADEAEILSLAVTPSRQRTGIGRQLLEEAMRRLYAIGIKRLFLEVDEANRSAINLYKSARFYAVGARSGYYRSGSKNALALVMRCDIV